MGYFIVTMAVVFGMTGSLPTVPHRFLAVVFALPLLVLTVLVVRKKKEIPKVCILEAHILACFLFYWVLKKESTVFYHILTKISGGFSAYAGAVAQRPLSMGVTYSGIDTVFFFLIALAAAALLYKSQRLTVKKYLLHTLAVFIIWGVYMGLWTFLAETNITLRINLLEPLTGPLDYRIVLFVMLFAYYMRIYRQLAEEDESGKPPKNSKPGNFARRLPAAILAVCVAVTAGFAFATAALVKDGVKQVVFLDTGIDFSVPEHGKYGLEYVGMFGVLPHYLNRQGYNCRIVDELNSTLLDETDVLVVFNPMYSLAEKELSEVWDFVREGGSVLAVGDHTGDEQVRLPLNAILEPVGISLNFDSAIPFKSLWAEGFQMNRSSVTSGIDSRSAQIVVGASLDGGFRAQPLVIGKEGYSDWGDMDNTGDGYLGDMNFNRGERIGDLVLVSEASYGSGKFMAFADTTTFQNTVIPYSYPLIDNVFAYLSDNGKQRSTIWEDDGTYQMSCVIDASHLEVLARDKSVNAADGLIACLLRAGLMPYMNQDEPLSEMLERLGDVELVVFMEPAAAFSQAEFEVLEQFMDEGGTVLLCAGYESPKAAKELAARYGFSFDPMPIGRIAPDKNPDMAFWNACPVLYQGEPPQESGGGAESLMEIWGHSTIAYKSVGSGGLYVFGDPDFLKNKNLESVDTYREGNVLFLDELLTDIREGRR